MGIALFAFYAFARVSGWISSSAELDRFDAQAAAAQVHGSAKGTDSSGKDDIDFSLWSDQRIRAFKETLNMAGSPALAVLQVQRLHIRVPVFEGTDDLTLNRGAGWINGTAKPGESGNIGIAAHRDGFFRALKDVRIGDLAELQVANKTTIYRVTKVQIINPEKVDVLMPRSEPTLTLVTCYTFYYVGSAPQRFIVQATLQDTNSSHGTSKSKP